MCFCQCILALERLDRARDCEQTPIEIFNYETEQRQNRQLFGLLQKEQNRFENGSNRYALSILSIGGGGDVCSSLILPQCFQLLWQQCDTALLRCILIGQVFKSP